MKIGMLSQWFDPETGPAALPGVYAREFVRQGHSVSVLTGFPNYPEGRLYPGYKIRPRARENTASLGVTRVALYPNHSASALGRVLNYTSFGVSAAAFGGKALRNADAIWAYNSPVTTSLPLLTHSKLGKTPIFLHVQDLWPDSLVESGMFDEGRITRQVVRAVERVVRLTERRSAVIGVISRSARELILRRNRHLDPTKVVYVPNPTNEEIFRPVNLIREEAGIGSDRDTVEVMYAGAIGEVQGLDALIDAADILHARRDIQFTLVGDGISRQRLERRTIELGLTNVRFMGRVPQQEIPLLLAQSDIQVVSLASRPFLAYTTPSKIPSLLASAVAIVAQIEGDGASLIRDSGAGLAVPPGCPEDLAAAIQKLVDAGSKSRENMGGAGRRYYEENLSSRSAALRIIDALEGSVGLG